MKTLRPVFDPTLHSGYVQILKRAILAAADLNIAVAGAFGAGKSSVLLGVRNDRRVRRRRVVAVSLASVHDSEASLVKASGEGSLVAALEKEVVKQLLYSAPPSRLPLSRFTRIRRRPFWSGVLLAMTVAFIAIGGAISFGVRGPGAAVAGLLELSDWWGWGLDAAFVAAIALCIYLLVPPGRLRDIGVGPARLSLGDDVGNYFDKYLDEIIYFFQKSRTRVVVFEDLDRFTDRGIYLALRELNNILNSAGQLRGRRITFVYAVRDTVFATPIDTTQNPAPADVVGQARARAGVDTPAAERAKFFDLIVPVVPFISLQMAADLMKRALSDLPDDVHQPDSELVRLVARDFVDMRVITSIRNEYIVFSRELLQRSNIVGLSHNSLFAMVCYKHSEPADFEAIRSHSSRLNTFIDAIDGAVASRIHYIDEQLAETRDRLAAEPDPMRRAAEAAARLVNRMTDLAALHGATVNQFRINGRSPRFTVDQVAGEKFWSELAASVDPTLIVTFNTGTELTFSGTTLRNALGRDWPVDRWLQLERADLERAEDDLIKLRAELVSSSLSRRITDETLSGPGRDGTNVDIPALARKSLSASLALRLFQSPFLDQNFVLYVTTYYGEFLSSNARTFIVKCVDSNEADPRFKLSEKEVNDVCNALGSPFLSHGAALNVSVIDTMLAGPESAVILEQFGRTATPHARSFFEIYLSSGQFPKAWASVTATRYPEVLQAIAEAKVVSHEARIELLGNALRNLSPNVEYAFEMETPEAIRAMVEALESDHVLRWRYSDDKVMALSRVMRRFRTRISDLGSVLDPRLRARLLAEGLFAINPANILNMTGSKAAGLDTILDREPGALRWVVGRLDDYLSALDSMDLGHYAVDHARLFPKLLAMLMATEGLTLDRVDGVLQRVAPSVTISKLSGLPADWLPLLAQHDRFPLTPSTVAEYMDSVQKIDDALAEFLSRKTRFELDGDETPEAARSRIAVAILELDPLPLSIRGDLVDSLDLDAPLDPTSLPRLGADALGWLLDRQLVKTDSQDLLAMHATISWPVILANVAKIDGYEVAIKGLGLSFPQLVDLIDTIHVPQGVADAARSLMDLADSSVTPASATRLIDRDLAADTPIGSLDLISLASAGVEPAHIVESLSKWAHTYTDDEVVATLESLPEPYCLLVVKSSKPRDVPASEGLPSLVGRLRGMGFVGPSEPHDLGDGNVRIWMRRK